MHSQSWNRTFSIALVGFIGVGASCHRADVQAAAKEAAPVVTPPPPPPAPPPPPPRNPDDLPPPDDVQAPPADAGKTDSGLAFKVLKPGTGKDRPTLADTVEVHYTGWTTDGRMFDSSVKRGQPAHFPVGGVIKGWTEGLQLMVVGEKRRFWIPAALAYGDSPNGGRPAGMLVFDVELLGMTSPPKVPEDVAAAPKSAKKTKSGIAYRVLKKGTGKDHPQASSTVEVHYSGWTTDGKMFDSSVARGQPATFPLSGVIPGWTEGVQLMVVGQKMRFWIPGNLAYDNSPRPGAPHGTLVFDIELLSIK
jgi:FKBP-type peptidyl-prolyl cis-trans isomerase